MNMLEILSMKTIKKLFPVLGRNPSTWNKAVVEMSKGSKMENILAGNADYMKKQRTSLEAKINKFYLEPASLPYLDNNTLKYHIRTFLTVICGTNGFMTTGFPYFNALFFDRDLFQPFYKQKILFEHYYFLSLELVNMPELFHLKDILKEYKRKNTIDYWWWKLYLKEYEFFIKRIKYRHDLEVEHFKVSKFFTRRPGYHLREYFGGADDYKVLYYD